MNVRGAIRKAEKLLPGTAAPEGEEDARWQAILVVGEFLRSDPEPVWRFIRRWGSHRDADLRAAVGTCLLEHLLEQHFDAFFPRVERAVGESKRFAEMFSACWKSGQSEQPGRAERFDALVRRVRRRTK